MPLFGMVWLNEAGAEAGVWLKGITLPQLGAWL